MSLTCIGGTYRYVKITLPEGVTDEGSMLSALQEQFEQILVSHGLLKEGLEAAADELGRGVLQESSVTAQRIREQTTEYVLSFALQSH